MCAYQIESLKAVQKKEVSENQRICRVIAKKGQIGNRTMDSQGVILNRVSVNLVQLLLGDENGAEWLRGKVESVQDAIVRKMVEGGKLAFYDDQIDMGSILAAMKSDNESGRFSKETIAAWFKDTMAPVLREKIVEKYTGISEDKIVKMLDAYLVNFSVLAQRQPSMPAETKAGLIRAMGFLAEDSEDADIINCRKTCGSSRA